MDRQKALDFLNKNVKQKNIINHMIATEAMMGALHDVLSKTNQIKETKEEWMAAGLLHDGDYSPDVPSNEHGIAVLQMLKDDGIEISKATEYCISAHNHVIKHVEPISLMDWSLFCGDSLTGLLVATALVKPEKKLSAVDVKSVLKKFKNLSFAGGTRREHVKLCQEKLGLSLEEFIEVTLVAMQGIANKLGL